MLLGALSMARSKGLSAGGRGVIVEVSRGEPGPYRAARARRHRRWRLDRTRFLLQRRRRRAPQSGRLASFLRRNVCLWGACLGNGAGEGVEKVGPRGEQDVGGDGAQ